MRRTRMALELTGTMIVIWVVVAALSWLGIRWFGAMGAALPLVVLFVGMLVVAVYLDLRERR